MHLSFLFCFHSGSAFMDFRTILLLFRLSLTSIFRGYIYYLSLAYTSPSYTSPSIVQNATFLLLSGRKNSNGRNLIINTHSEIFMLQSDSNFMFQNLLKVSTCPMGFFTICLGRFDLQTLV